MPLGAGDRADRRGSARAGRRPTRGSHVGRRAPRPRSGPSCARPRRPDGPRTWLPRAGVADISRVESMVVAASWWAAVTMRSASVFASDTVASAVRWASNSVRLIVSASPALTGSAGDSRAVLTSWRRATAARALRLHRRRLVLRRLEGLGHLAEERLDLVGVESALGRLEGRVPNLLRAHLHERTLVRSVWSVVGL